MYDVQNMFSLVRSKNAYLHYVKKLLFGITSSLRGEKDEELEEGATRTEARTEVERGGGVGKREMAGRIRGFQCQRDRFTQACD